MADLPGKENPTRKRKVNGQISLKNVPKRQLVPTAKKHRISRFVKGENGTIERATGREVRAALLEATQSTVLRSLGPQEAEFSSQRSTLVEMEVTENRILDLDTRLEQLEQKLERNDKLNEKRFNAIDLRLKRLEPILEETLNVCGRAFFDKCIYTFCETAQAYGYFTQGDHRFKKAWLDSPEAVNFAATGRYSMVIFDKRIQVTPDLLTRMKTFRGLSGAVSATTAHQTTFLNVALCLTKNLFFQIPAVMDMFHEIFASTPRDVVENFEGDSLSPYFLSKFRVNE